ncbi:PAS domain S-box protein [Frateuria sp. MAH-13]|uniref:histidine kinase n=1 Tax=Frateuria flava TaxID=2821489 RepID=A0ABS4DP09_9GAMM|nr:PAS domain S-box protein [Frateuria flava]
MPEPHSCATLAAELAGAGETGALIAARDWSQSPLGPLESWPSSLRVALGIVLRAPSPMALSWGEQGILLYNDGYAALAGSRHPAALGASTFDVWPEAAELNARVQATVLAGGTLSYRDMEMTLARGGPPRQALFHVDYSPVYDEMGRPAGVLCVALETTGRVVSERHNAILLRLEEALRGLAEPRAIMDATVDVLGRQLGASRAGYSEVQDDDRTIVCESCYADGVAPLLGTFHLEDFGAASVARQRGGATEIVDDIASDSAQQQATWAAIDARAFISVPLVRDGRLQASLYVNARQPRHWSSAEIALVEATAVRSWNAVQRAIAERALRESDARFRVVAELSPDAILITRNHVFAWANAAAARLHGMDSPQQLIGRSPLDFCEPEARPVVLQNMDRILSGQRLERATLVLVRADGTRVPVEGSASLVTWEGQPATEVLLRDVTERKAAEDALRASAQRLRLAMDAGRLAEVTLRVKPLAIVSHSPAFAQLMGHPPSTQLTADDFREQCHPDDFDRLIAEREAFLVSGEEYYQSEQRIVLPDGRIRWLYGRGRLSRDADGRPSELTAVFLDDSERKRAELALRDLNDTLEYQVAERTNELRVNQARMRGAFETSYVLQGLVSPEGIVMDANRTALLAIGCRREQVLGRPLWETAWFTGTPGMPEVVREWVALAAQGHRLRREARLNLADGWRWFDFSMRPLVDANGVVTGIMPEAVETTERRQAEEALRQSQKLEAMGQLTGGVAHDFNNLLTPILGGLDMLQQRGLGGPREQRLIDGALKSAERARMLVQRLLAFARRQPLKACAVDIGKLLHGMADLIASTLGPQIHVAVQVDEPLPAARADPNQLEMALLNLAVNARDAMPEGGTLRLAASVVEIGPGHRSRLPLATYVCLSVADTGTGMDEATMTRAIEPFFSTKGLGKGTGLGLSMAHGLASQLGGALLLQSTPGLGTKVQMLLPISSEPPGVSQAMPETAEPVSTSDTALLVDDEDLVRASTAAMLAELGYTVVQAGSAEEALRSVHAGLRPDLLVTDHLMPGTSGTELAHELRALLPALPVLVISGYTDVADVAPELARLTKPFRKADLAASLEALLLR